MDAQLVPLVSAGIGAATALVAVGLKALYDSRVEHRKLRRENASLFLVERRQAYDRFLQLHRSALDRSNRLRELGLVVRDNGTPPLAEELAAFPPSSMADLSAALDQIRRLARSYDLVRAAEHMMQLHADLIAAQRKTLDAVTGGGATRERELLPEAKQNDDILWFVLTNHLRDRELEFVYSYRAELGIGDPEGGPKRYPIEQRDRPWPLAVAERIVREHLLPFHPDGPSGKMPGPRPDDLQS